jgi:hypothetical protein
MATLPSTLATTFERPQKVEEGRRLLVEILVKTSDARARFLGLGQLSLGDPALHCVATLSRVRTKSLNMVREPF